MNSTTFHYLFAHQALPHWFFCDPENTVAQLSSLEAKNFVLKVYSDLFKRVPPTERASMAPLDLDAITIHASFFGSKRCAVVEMPPPENCVEAFMVALYQGDICRNRFFGHLYPEGRRNHYFTLEKPTAIVGKDFKCVFGAWSENGHCHIGCSLEPTVDAFSAFLLGKIIGKENP